MRYTLVSDNDGHRFIIPLDKTFDFDKWLDTDEDLPDYAHSIEGGELSFEAPRYDDHIIAYVIFPSGGSGWYFSDESVEGDQV